MPKPTKPATEPSADKVQTDSIGIPLWKWGDETSNLTEADCIKLWGEAEMQRSDRAAEDQLRRLRRARGEA